MDDDDDLLASLLRSISFFTLLSSNQTHSTAQFRRTSIPRRRKLSTKASRFSHFSTAKITDSDFRLLQKPRKTPWKKIKNKIKVSDSLSLSLSLYLYLTQSLLSFSHLVCFLCSKPHLSLSLSVPLILSLSRRSNV